MVRGLRNSRVIKSEPTVHMHKVLLDTHAKAPNLTANVSVYVMNSMFMLIANVLVIMFLVKMNGALTYQDIRAIKALKRIREPRNTVGVLERITRRLLLFHREIGHLQESKQIMMRSMEQYVLVIRLFRDYPTVIAALEEIWETIDDEDEFPVAMRYYFLILRFTSKMEFQFTNEQKHRNFKNLPRGHFEAQDNDDYEEIDDDMLDEGSDVEDPDF